MGGGGLEIPQIEHFPIYGLAKHLYYSVGLQKKHVSGNT